MSLCIARNTQNSPRSERFAQNDAVKFKRARLHWQNETGFWQTSVELIKTFAGERKAGNACYLCQAIAINSFSIKMIKLRLQWLCLNSINLGWNRALRKLLAELRIILVSISDTLPCRNRMHLVWHLSKIWTHICSQCKSICWTERTELAGGNGRELTSQPF